MVPSFDPFSGLRPIGFWKDHDQPNLPDPAGLVDLSWDTRERELVAEVLGSAATHQPGEGCSLCRICGAPNGFLDLSDGTYIWPEGLAHYGAGHSVRLEADVMADLLSRHSDLDAAGRDIQVVADDSPSP